MSDSAVLASARAVALRFAPGRTPVRIQPLGSGHIHATFRAAYDGGGADLVLQRLNEHVFPDLDALMANLVLVTGHLRRAGPATRSALELVVTTAGDALVRDGSGAAWRALRFVEDTRSYDAAPDDGVARSAARAFGQFAAQLSDLDPSALALPIPGFHDLPVRLGQLRGAAAADAEDRLAALREECSSILELGEEVTQALERGGAARLPLRVVHNDCKLNNLLFDAASGEPLCVVDLDTVMPGLLLVDFGELVRTAACAAAEDEPDLSRVVFSQDRFDALAEGYVEGIGAHLSGGERELLWLGPPWMAIENAARFLTDHLQGDRYFASGDNRARARAQLELARQLWGARRALAETLEHAGPPRTRP